MVNFLVKMLGVVDSSGIRLWLTPTPQTYEAATLEIGENISPQMFVPPRQEHFLTYGYCPANCIEGVNYTYTQYM